MFFNIPMFQGKPCAACVGGLGLVLLLLGFMTYAFFDTLVNSLVAEELIIRNGSEMYKSWKDPPFTPHLRMYFFNLTNLEEFLNGEKPVFKEVGPYCYREQWHRVKIAFHDNGTVTYATKRFYYFDREHSSGPDDEVVITANIPLLTSVYHVRFAAHLVKLALSSLLEVLNEKAFIKRTVHELLWGYDDPLLRIAKDILPPEQRLPTDKFGLFIGKNGTADGVLNVYTGVNGMYNYTMIDTYNNKTKLTYWNTDTCNEIRGTDGTSFPPDVRRDTTLYMFNGDLCRSLPLTYVKDIEKFSPPPDVFAWVSDKPENECYCVGGPPCVGGGVFNISVCKYGSPTILSWPHFYQADKMYREAVIGMQPNAEKHALYADVSPRTGTPLAAEARLQVNVAMIKERTIDAVRNLQDILFPVCWFEDVYKSTMELSFFVIGAALLVGALLALAIYYWHLPLPFMKPTLESKSFSPSNSSVKSEKPCLEGHINRAMSVDDLDKSIA